MQQKSLKTANTHTAAKILKEHIDLNQLSISSFT